MIGKPLSERYGHGATLPSDRAVTIVVERLGPDRSALVQVRAQGPGMVACLVVTADAAAVRLCRDLGLDMRLFGTGVVGLLGDDVARLMPRLSAAQKAWLRTRCGTRETKILLVAGGLALVSVDTTDGRAVVTPFE